MTGVTWILIYFAIALFTLVTYRKTQYVYCGIDGEGSLSVRPRRDGLRLLLIFFYAILFVLLNVYCTKTSAAYGSDRVNYAFEFTGHRGSGVGLDILFGLFRALSLSFTDMLYFTTFVSVLVILLAHGVFEYSSRLSLAFLLSTDFVFFTFTALKQSYSCAFAALLFVLLIKKRTLGNVIGCVLLITLAILFHPASVVLIPLFLVCSFRRLNKTIILLYMVVLALAFVFFMDIGAFLANLVEPLFPKFAEMLTRYFKKLDRTDVVSAVAFLKGVSFYLLFGFGCIYRKRIKKTCLNYDKYLVILATASVLCLCSVYVYWTMRFRAFFYLPAAIFFGILFKNISKKERIVLTVSTLGANLVLLVRWLLLIYSNYGGF